MRIFVKKIVIFFSPFGLIVPIILFYLCTDPFMVIYKYNSYFISGKPRYVCLNYDYVAVETFLNNYPKYKYNSFIIGNSRSRFYEMEKWSEYIGTDHGFHFDASSESIYGIEKKMEFLDAMQVKFKNVLIILDHNTLMKVTNNEGYLFISHPLMSQQNILSFHFEFFKAFISMKFLIAYTDYKLSGKVKNYMIKGDVLDTIPHEYNVKYNEMKLKVFEDMIKLSPSKYFNKTRMKRFYDRDTIRKYSPEVIGKEQTVMLKNIHNILIKHASNFKIIISPLYDQVNLSKKDLERLRSIFGKENVFDFSGINSFTSNYQNYYEESHYRPLVGNSILDVIYTGQITGSN